MSQYLATNPLYRFDDRRLYALVQKTVSVVDCLVDCVGCVLGGVCEVGVIGENTEHNM